MLAKKTILLCLTAAMAAASLAGCNNAAPTKSDGTLSEVTTPDSYPIETNETITYYTKMDSVVSDVFASLNDTEFAKQLTKQTGIKVEFKHPAVGQEAESFNILFASGDYPDIIENYWNKYKGGAAGALADGVIIPLNDIVEKVSPNLKSLLEKEPSVKKSVSVNGDIYMYPFYRSSDILCTYYGAMVRGDVLDKLGMDVPETIDEWEAVLRAFKNEFEVPFTTNLTPSFQSSINLLSGAYGISSGLYIDDGKVKYGPYEAAYRDYVAKMADWYKEGLIDSEFSVNDDNRITSMVINGQIGMITGSNGSNFGTWLAPMREKNPGAELVPVPYPTLNKGDRPQFGQSGERVLGYGGAITSSCKNIELAARLLDYGYSQAGEVLYNFGVEGESFEMKDGAPTYLPAIIDAEKLSGRSMAQQLGNYTRVCTIGPFVQSEDYIMQFYREEVQKDALKTWSDTDARKHLIPTGLVFSDTDSAKISKLMGDINTCTDEAVLKMIMGTKSLDEYDAFVAELKASGIEEVLDIYQKAYDSYLAD